MTRRRNMADMFLAILSICCIINVQQVFAQPKLEKPNFVLIMTDDQGWGSVSERSEVLSTPGLDTLIENGIHFNRFYSASAVCSPTRAAFLTGRNPFRLGIPWANEGHLKQEEITIAELAKEAGYATGLFGKWHLGTLTKLRSDGNRGGSRPQHYSPPWYHGFDKCFATESSGPTYDHPIDPTDWPYTDNSTGLYGHYFWETPPDSMADTEGDTVAFEEVMGDAAKLVVDKAIDLIDSSHEANVPFLATVWIHTPHAVVVVPRDSANKYYPEVENENFRVYYTSLEMMTLQVLKLYKHLEAKGILDNTFFLFTSDNGAAHTQGSFKHPKEAVNVLRGGKTQLWEGGIRVPGMLVWPDRIPEKIETDFPVFTSDIYPTIKAILQSEVDEQKPLDGINLLPVIDALVGGQDDLHRNKPMGFLIKEGQAWIDNDMKLIRTNSSQPWELYNLSDDISETTNLAATETQKLDSMASSALAWKDLVDNDELFDFETETNAEPSVDTRSKKINQIADYSNAEIFVYDLEGKLQGQYLNHHSRLALDGSIENKLNGLYLIEIRQGNDIRLEKQFLRGGAMLSLIHQAFEFAVYPDSSLGFSLMSN